MKLMAQKFADCLNIIEVYHRLQFAQARLAQFLSVFNLVLSVILFYNMFNRDIQLIF